MSTTILNTITTVIKNYITNLVQIIVEFSDGIDMSLFIASIDLSVGQQVINQGHLAYIRGDNTIADFLIDNSGNLIVYDNDSYVDNYSINDNGEVEYIYED